MPQTPSARAHSLVNPLPQRPTDQERGVITWLKFIVGTPVPILMTLYAVSLLTSMSGMELTGWLTAILTLKYIILDRFSKEREFNYFMIGTDISLIGFVVIVAAGLLINAPEANFLKELGSVRWVLLLYLLTYSFSIFPGINKLLYVIMSLGAVIGVYAIVQHFTGIDLRYEWGLRSQSAVTPAPVSNSMLYQSVGLMSHHLTYGYLFSMVFCFPLAALMLSKSKSLAFRILMLIATSAIGMSLVWTYGRGVWIATAASILFMGAYVSKRALFGLLVLLGIFCGTFYSANDSFKQRVDSIWAQDNQSNNDRQDLWRANVEMFGDHPWIGVGWNQNEGLVADYYKRLGIENKFTDHAHNTYLQVMANTGLLGFIFFAFFILGFLLMTHRLWTEVPKSHYWHRVIVLGALGSQISLHAGGLTQWNFGDAEVNHFFIFVLALVAYMSEQYGTGVVPDDHSL